MGLAVAGGAAVFVAWSLARRSAGEPAGGGAELVRRKADMDGQVMIEGKRLRIGTAHAGTIVTVILIGR